MASFDPILPIATSRSRRRRRRRLYSGWPQGAKERTAQQLFELAMAKEMERDSFVDKIKGAGAAAFRPVEWTFDKLLRPTYGLAEGIRQAGKMRSGDPKRFLQFGEGFWEGFKGDKKTTFSDVLKEEGILKGHGRLRGLAGFSMDVLLDPTTYLSFGTTAVAKTGATATMKLAQKAGRQAISGSSAKALPDLRRALEKAGPDFSKRAALVAKREAMEKGPVHAGDIAQLNILRGMARTEERAKSARAITFGFGKLRTPATPRIRLPNKGLADLNIPVVSAGAGKLRGAVGSGLNDEVRTMRVARKHIGEQLTDDYLHFIRRRFEGIPRLKTERVVKTLSRFETPGGVVKQVDEKGNVTYVLNEKRITELKGAGKMDEAEEEFLRAWHDMGEFMAKQDKGFGIEYEHLGDFGKLYVPHIMDRGGNPFTDAARTMLKQQGYVRGRKNTNLTLGHIKSLVDAGKLPKNIETDPWNMMVNIARTRAAQHADKSAIDAMTLAVGVPRKVVDKATQTKIRQSNRRIDELTANLQKYDTPGKRNLVQYKRMSKELDELTAQVKKLSRGKRNKEYHTGLTKVERIKDEFGNAIGFEPEIAAALQRIEKITVADDEAITAFGRAWAKMLGNWKLLVTSVNPGYRFRNTLSDAWGMYVAGVPVWAMARYSGRAARLMRAAKNGDERAIRKLTDAYHAGVLSGLFQGDIQTIASMLARSGSKKALLKSGRGYRLATKVAQDMNRNAENWGRLTHYLYRVEHQKMGVADAAFEVKKAHFDYEDLTEFERQKLKNLFPFYTWTRKNVPFQIQALVSRPGKFAAFPKFAIESEKAAGGDPGNVLPDFLSENFAFQIPFGKSNYLSPQIGAADLARFQTPGAAFKNVGSMLNPFMKVPIELMTDKSLFTGAPIKEGVHPRVPIAEGFAPFAALVPGANVGPTARSTPRGRVVGAGAHPYVAYFAGQIPLGREVLVNPSNIKEAQKGIKFGSKWSYFGGLSVTHVDREQQMMIERLQLRDKLKRRVQGLRDEGRYPLAEKKKKSKHDKDIEREIAFGLGR